MWYSFEMERQPLTTQKIAASIYLIRGCKVMLDSDLAVLYGVETKYLKRQVKRNLERFPPDFLYRLTKKEVAALRCQIGTLDSPGRGQYSKYLPYAFTEHGILMLSSVLSSQKAIQVNIAIMRVFARIRQVLIENKDLALHMERLERHVERHGKDIRSLFDFVERILAIDEKPKGPIGFHP